MPRRSAGLLPYLTERHGRATALRVMLVHPGGPYWAKKDLGVWSICKGEASDDEVDLRAVARREFLEEIGQAPPAGEWLELGEIRQNGGKRVTAWAVEGTVDVDRLTSNTVEIEWPPRSGRTQAFPEVDRAAWFELDEARRRILPSQLGLLATLLELVAPPAAY